jgi:hypothetical protein
MSKRKLPAAREDYGALGPCMRALPNDKWRDYVFHYVSHPPGHGAQARAARLAGFAKGSKPIVVAKIAHRLAHDPRMIEAIAEQSKKMVRAGAPEAVNALYEMIRDPSSKDRMAAVRAVLNRVDPEVAHQNLQVTHRIVDPDQEAVEELRAARALGAPRSKLLELFGENGLARVERLEAADASRRAAEAKVIDADFSEVQNGQ